MDCCSADGYAQTYTDIIRKVTKGSDFGIILILVTVLIMCRYLYRRIYSNQDQAAPNVQAKKED